MLVDGTLAELQPLCQIDSQTSLPDRGCSTVEVWRADQVRAAVEQSTELTVLRGVGGIADDDQKDRKSTRLNSSHVRTSRMPSSA